MYEESLATMAKKPWNSLTDVEKVEELHNSINQVFSRLADMNSVIGSQANEITFWRKFYSIEKGLSSDQLRQIFEYGLTTRIRV